MSAIKPDPVQTFREQQRKTNHGPYHFMRRTEWQTDTVPGRLRQSRQAGGFNIFSTVPARVMTRPFFHFSCRPPSRRCQPAAGGGDEREQTSATIPSWPQQCRALADEVEQALHKYAIVNHPQAGKVFAFEVDAFGNYYCTDDGNIPNLLSLPYLGAVPVEDPLYQNTRKMLLSAQNPYYCIGTAGSGLGGPHVGVDMIWPLGVIIEGLTATNDAEIKQCLTTFAKNAFGTGFMHEAFNKDNPKKFTRSWFAWANTIFGELVLKTYQQKPSLLN